MPRFEDDVVTLTTVIWNGPGAEAWQPAGADAEGASEEVTPWGIGFARAAPIRASRARPPFILMLFAKAILWYSFKDN